MKTYWVLAHCHWLRVTTSLARWAAIPHAGLHTACVAGAIGMAGLGGLALLPARPVAAAAASYQRASPIASPAAPMSLVAFAGGAGPEPAASASGEGGAPLDSAGPPTSAKSAAATSVDDAMPPASGVNAETALPPDRTGGGPAGWLPGALPPVEFAALPPANMQPAVDVPEPPAIVIFGAALSALAALARPRRGHSRSSMRSGNWRTRLRVA